MAKGKAPAKKPALPAADRKSGKTDGKKAEQLTLAAETPAPRAPAASAPEPTKRQERAASTSERSEGSRVIELVMSASGAFKRLASGKKVPLNDQEWQLELSRLLAHKAPAETVPDAAGGEN